MGDFFEIGVGKPYKIRAEDSEKLYIYEGCEQIGRPETVLLRGKVVVENAAFVGELGQGEFIPSEAYAYCYEGGN